MNGVCGDACGIPVDGGEENVNGSLGDTNVGFETYNVGILGQK